MHTGRAGPSYGNHGADEQLAKRRRKMGGIAALMQEALLVVVRNQPVHAARQLTCGVSERRGDNRQRATAGLDERKRDGSWYPSSSRSMAKSW